MAQPVRDYSLNQSIQSLLNVVDDGDSFSYKNIRGSFFLCSAKDPLAVDSKKREVLENLVVRAFLNFIGVSDTCGKYASVTNRVIIALTHRGFATAIINAIAVECADIV